MRIVYLTVRKASRTTNYTAYIPTIGILIFFGLFIYASTLYPGGSQANLDYIAYDWANNYWCNLMNEFAMNEQPNPARPVAIIAMVILCSSIMFFFIQFSQKVAETSFWRNSIKWGGILSMLTAMFMFSQFHDLMTIISSILGVLAVIGIIWHVYKSGWTLFKITGGLCIILLGVNNYIYYSEAYIEYLPIVQKITFLVVLMWIAGLNITLNKPDSSQ